MPLSNLCCRSTLFYQYSSKFRSFRSEARCRIVDAWNMAQFDNKVLFFVSWGWYRSGFWSFSLGFSWSEGIQFPSSHMFVLHVHDHKRDSVGCKRACYGVRACMRYLQCHIKTTVHITKKWSNEARHYLSLQNNFRNKPCKASGLCLSTVRSVQHQFPLDYWTMCVDFTTSPYTRQNFSFSLVWLNFSSCLRK